LYRTVDAEQLSPQGGSDDSSLALHDEQCNWY
jgi:hypothetical protein